MQLLNMHVMWLTFKTARRVIKLSEQQRYWWWWIGGTACREVDGGLRLAGLSPDDSGDGKGQVHLPRVAGDCGGAGNISLLNPVSHHQCSFFSKNNNNLKTV